MHPRTVPFVLPPCRVKEGSAGLHSPSSEELIPEIQAHQLRRRFPSDNSLRRGDRPFTGLRHPKVRWSFNYRCLAKPKPSDVLRPFLGRSLSRPALLFRPKSSEPRRASSTRIREAGASKKEILTSNLYKKLKF
jgi:hypothetical protein